MSHQPPSTFSSETTFCLPTGVEFGKIRRAREMPVLECVPLFQETRHSQLDGRITDRDVYAITSSPPEPPSSSATDRRRSTRSFI